MPETARNRLLHDLPAVTVRTSSVSEMDNNVYLLTSKTTGAQVLIDAADDAEAIRDLIASAAGDTPCAEKTTVAPSGTSSVRSTNTAPRSARVDTTWRLCTISLRTYTGAPCASSARSTVSTARSTPAQ